MKILKIKHEDNNFGARVCAYGSDVSFSFRFQTFSIFQLSYELVQTKLSTQNYVKVQMKITNVSLSNEMIDKRSKDSKPQMQMN